MLSDLLNQVHHADALTFLRGLPDAAVHCVITSPPYFNLRVYGGGEREIGSETMPEAYIEHLVAIFREARRVLHPTGVLWLNLGDSYANDTKWGGTTSGIHAAGLRGKTGIGRNRHRTGLPSKSLLGIPHKVAFALQADGWILRADAPWIKRNGMPGSQTDRPTLSKEYVFLFARQPHYWYDTYAIERPAQAESLQRGVSVRRDGTDGHPPLAKQDALGKRTYTGFNARYFSGDRAPTRRYRDTDMHFDALADDIAALRAELTRLEALREAGGVQVDDNGLPLACTFSTRANHFAHFAVMPPSLIEPLVLAGCPAQVCAMCGAPYRRMLDKGTEVTVGGTPGSRTADLVGASPTSSLRTKRWKVYETLGFAPTCTCNAAIRPGVVLDPFAGSGTTLLVARQFRRDALGCDLNAEYVALANQRITSGLTDDDRERLAHGAQLTLF